MTQTSLLNESMVDADDSDTWNTPGWLVDLVVETIGQPDLDPCTNLWAKMPAKKKYSIKDDGLSKDWDPRARVWCNPPYSDPSPWLEKMSRQLGMSMALIKHDHSTGWWRLYCRHKHHIQLHRRVRFERPGAKSIAPNFCSSIVLFGDWGPTRLRVAEGGFYNVGTLVRGRSA